MTVTGRVIRVYDATGNVIETHEHKGDFEEWSSFHSHQIAHLMGSNIVLFAVLEAYKLRLMRPKRMSNPQKTSIILHTCRNASFWPRMSKQTLRIMRRRS